MGLLARLDAITVIDSVMGGAPVGVGTYLGLATLTGSELPTGASRRDQVAPMVNAALDSIDVVAKGG